MQGPIRICYCSVISIQKQGGRIDNSDKGDNTNFKRIGNSDKGDKKMYFNRIGNFDRSDNMHFNRISNSGKRDNMYFNRIGNSDKGDKKYRYFKRNGKSDKGDNALTITVTISLYKFSPSIVMRPNSRPAETATPALPYSRIHPLSIFFSKLPRNRTEDN
jgi:hypothetical protein